MSATTPIRWKSTETDPAGTVRDALSIALGEAWVSAPPAQQARYLRALLCLTFRSALLSPNPPPAGSDGIPVYGDLRGGNYDDGSRLFVASTIARTPMLLILPEKGQTVDLEIAPVETVDGQPAQPLAILGGEAGALPAIVWIAGLCLASLASVYIAGKTAEVIDRSLARDADVRKLVATQANAITVIQDHERAEAQAGKRLAWSPEKIKLFETLLEQQKMIAAKKEAPLPSPFDGAIETAKNAASSVKNFAGSIAEAVLPPVLIAGAVIGGLYLLTKTSGGGTAERAPREPEDIEEIPLENGTYLQAQRRQLA